MFRVRVPLQRAAGTKINVLFYARYSTEEQDASSITDQHAYCKKFLDENGINDYVADKLQDAEMSGELVSRPGIDRVREGIIAHRWQLIVVEDSSRLFRHATACGKLIETAVDQDIRVIAINDDVDTAKEGWDKRLHEAAGHHTRSNRYTSIRIKRSMEGLWCLGAAVGPLRAGCCRKATKAATQREPEEGPFYDEIDSKWPPVIYEAYKRIGRDEPPWSVATWLTEQGLPKPRNALTKEWTKENVIRLIKNAIYKGSEVYRATVIKKHYGTGKHVPVLNEPDQVLVREMPHLRIVPDHLWNKANDAIKARCKRPSTLKGSDHPLASIPRDSRGPLSGLFFCGVCGSKMYVDGRTEGGYRCSQTREHRCWNRCTVLYSFAHAQIGQAVAG